MAPNPAKPAAARKRTRKRKRRAVSSSSSSSSDDSSSSSDAPDQTVVRVPVKAAKKRQPEPSKEPEPSSPSSSSDSESDSDNASEAEPARELSPQPASKAAPQKARRRSPSPTPPPAPIPPFLPPKGTVGSEQQDEQVLKERFRKFWMASVADAFKDDLEEIRKEPNMTTSRLAMLIDSLAAGGDVFASSQAGPDGDATEMQIVVIYALASLDSYKSFVAHLIFRGGASPSLKTFLEDSDVASSQRSSCSPLPPQKVKIYADLSTSEELGMLAGMRFNVEHVEPSKAHTSLSTQRPA